MVYRKVYDYFYAPGNASNEGGVATSGLELVQNYICIYWNRGQLDEKLKEIMSNIHAQCMKYGAGEDGKVD